MTNLQINYTPFPAFCQLVPTIGLRKFTVGINGLEFTLDAQIKYLA